MKLSGKNLIVLLIFFLGCHALTAQTGEVFSLDQAIDYALKHSNTIKNSQLNIADAEAQIVERRSSGLPQLRGNANFQHYLKLPIQPLPPTFQTFGFVFQDLRPFLSDQTLALLDASSSSGGNSDGVSFFLKNNLTASLNLDVMIFDGTYFIALQGAKAYRAYVAQELKTKEREVRNKVRQAFYPVLLFEKNMALLDKNIANLEKLRFETSELYKAGFAEQLDVDRLELSLTNLQSDRDNLTRQRETSLRVLKFNMNYPLDQPLDVTGDLDQILIDVSDENLLGNINYQQRPEVDLIEQAIDLNELNIKNIKAGYLPSLSGSAVYQQSYYGDNLKDGFWAPANFVGLKLDVPIFDGFYKKSQIQRAKLDLEEVLNQKSDLKQSINLEVSNARTDYFNARERLASQQRNIALAERIYETTQVKYREGVGSSLEVSQAEQSLYSTQSNYIQALYDLVVAKSNLEAALGK